MPTEQKARPIDAAKQGLGCCTSLAAGAEEMIHRPPANGKEIARRATAELLRPALVFWGAYTRRVLVSVVIPVKDDDRLFDCLHRIVPPASGEVELEVLVVDNGSEPELRRALNELPPEVSVLNESVPGAFAARNRGIDAAGGSVVLLTDADCVPADGWVEEAFAALDRTGADIVQGFSGTKAPERTVGGLIQRR